jgi:hypothetical protein
VASATETFLDAIEDGVSGLLVRDTAEWRRALDLLIASESRRKAIGDAARAVAQARFSLAAVVPRAIAALGLRQSPAAAQARTAVAGEPQGGTGHSRAVAKLCSDHESVDGMG